MKCSFITTCVLAVCLSCLTSLYGQNVLSPGSIKAIRIVSGVNGDIPTDKNKTIVFDDDCTLYPVCIYENNGERQILSPADSVSLSGKIHDALPIDDYLADYTITWFKIENDAERRWYSNTDPVWHWDTLDYKRTEWTAGSLSVSVDVAPTVLTPLRIDGKAVGTMRFQVTVEIDGQTYSSPGIEPRYKGCITESVHRISRRGRTGNGILDYAFALCNNPYIWGSASFTGSKFDNQAERFLGADCADFAVASARLAGYTLMPYGGSRTLSPYTYNIASIQKTRRGVYIDRQDKQIAVGNAHVRPGDFIVWDGHVGLFYKDTEPIGLLDESDLTLHTLFAEPKIETLKNAYQHRFSIRRPKQSLRE